MDQMMPRRVFVVDDDDAVRDSLRVLLESFGIVVRDYASARDFLGAGWLDSGGCLLLDLHMPEMSGIDLLEFLQGENSRLPVIVITGRGDPALKERVLRFGAQDLLDKPVDEIVLMRALDRAFATYAGSR